MSTENQVNQGTNPDFTLIGSKLPTNLIENIHQVLLVKKIPFEHGSHREQDGFYRLPKCRVTIWKNNTVVLQGELAKETAEMLNLPVTQYVNKNKNNSSQVKIQKPLPQRAYQQNAQETIKKIYIGCDEAGVGEFFGPVCFALCIVDEKANEFFAKNIIKDSKELNHAQILTKAQLYLQNLQCEIKVMPNSLFNDLIVKTKKINNNELKTVCYLDLLKKTFDKYKLIPSQYQIIIDGYATTEIWFKHIGQKTTPAMQTFAKSLNVVLLPKADRKYSGVAVASVLAKEKYLSELIVLRKKYNFAHNIPYGNDPKRLEEFILYLKSADGVSEQLKSTLWNIAKLNFDKYLLRFNLKL